MKFSLWICQMQKSAKKSSRSLLKRKRDITRFDLDQLAKVADGFSGAEIEQALIAAMYEAFAQDREFTQLDIIAAIKSTLPLSEQ